jgi:anti-sigma B factor antagonist
MAQVQPPARARVPLAVVTLPAEIDMANADRVGADLQAAFALGVATVVADMTATTFCDSRGIHALVLAHQRATASGAELRLVAPSAGVLRVLALTGLDRWLAIYPSLPEALGVQPAPKS